MRSVAIPRLEGELAIFADDDVLPQPDWLVRLSEAARAFPDYSIFEGTIIPDWPATTPEWVRR